MSTDAPASVATARSAPVRRQRRGRAAGALIVALVAVVAALAPALPLADPNRTQPSRRLAPPLSPDHPLGSDHLGRDLLSRVVWGARVSLVVGVLATLLAMLAGTAVGLVTGFYGGLTDNLAMRGIDLIMAFPYILLAMLLVAALGPGLVNAMLAVAVVNVSFYARGVRAAVLLLREQEFVEAARAVGSTEGRILRRHIPGLRVDEHRGHDHRERRPLVHRPRRPAADRGLGHHAGRRPPVHHGGRARGRDSGPRDLRPGARL
jgi:peptide/nickel transport system permease protein